MAEKASTAMTMLGYMLLAFNTAATLAAQAKELIGQISVWWNG